MGESTEVFTGILGMGDDAPLILTGYAVFFAALVALTLWTMIGKRRLSAQLKQLDVLDTVTDQAN